MIPAEGALRARWKVMFLPCAYNHLGDVAFLLGFSFRFFCFSLRFQLVRYADATWKLGIVRFGNLYYSDRDDGRS